MSARHPAFDFTSAAHVAFYDELSLWSALAGQLLLEHVPLDAMRVLDLGCGTGFPSLELAERLGPGAFVVGVDPWRRGLERAQAKARVWPVPGFAPVLGDGARLPLRGGSLDLVVSNLGVNNFDDADSAFAECRRVLAPGGRIAIASNLAGHFRELYAAFADVLERAGDAAALERLREHVAHRATVAGLSATLARHGLRVTAMHERDVVWRFRDGAAVFEHHFIRLGFLPAWREVAGEGAGTTLELLRDALDARERGQNGLFLTVPLAVLIAHAG